MKIGDDDKSLHIGDMVKRRLLGKKIIVMIVAILIGIFRMPIFVHAQGIAFNREEQEYIRDKGIIQAASLDGGAPLQYRNSKGEMKGIAINILNEIATSTGLTFEYTLYDTIEEAFASDADIFFSISKEYQPSGIALSKPYLHTEAILFYNASLNLNDIQGKRFAMIKGGTIPKEINEENVVYFADREATIKAVNEGEADYGYSNSYSLLFHTLQNGYDNVMTIPQKKEDRAYCIGVHEENKVLLGILNKAVEAMSESRTQSLTLMALADVEKKITPYMILENYKKEIIGFGILSMAVLISITLSKIKANKRLNEELLKTKKQEEIITQISFHDSLTGLYNRAYITDMLERIDTVRQLPISIIVTDINGLKVVNDTFGHLEGDKVIQKAAFVLKDSCRSEDIVARIGGDEFMIVLPQTPFEAVAQITERIGKHCKSECDQPVPVSISVGVATKTKPEEKIENLIKEADAMMYQHKLLESRSVRSSILSSLQASLHEKDIETTEHILRLIETTAAMGERLQLSALQMDHLNLLARVHDIGKITVDERILKKKGPLTEEELSEVRRHSEAGYRIAESTHVMADIAKYILYHHERWDGKGYPHGLKGEEIPLLSRILIIADAYDVMTHDREYKKAIDQKAAIDELERCSGKQFDPNLVPIFISVIRK